jgi:hypothetical protein
VLGTFFDETVPVGNIGRENSREFLGELHAFILASSRIWEEDGLDSSFKLVELKFLSPYLSESSRPSVREDRNEC